jgi:hypothetical protein
MKSVAATVFRIRTTLRIRLLAVFFKNIVFLSSKAFKDNKLIRSHKTAEINVFNNFFGLLIKGSGYIQIITNMGGPKT